MKLDIVFSEFRYVGKTIGCHSINLCSRYFGSLGMLYVGGSREGRHLRFAERLSNLDESPRYVDARPNVCHDWFTANVARDRVELAIMGDDALCIFIAMARAAEASTGGRREERVQAVWRDPTYIRAVNKDQDDNLGQLSQSQLQMTRPVAWASLETEFGRVFQVVWTAHSCRLGVMDATIDSTLANAERLPDPDPEGTLSNVRGRNVLLTDRNGNLCITTRQNMIFWKRLFPTLFQTYLLVRSLVYEHLVENLDNRKRTVLVQELCERSVELNEQQILEIMLLYSGAQARTSPGCMNPEKAHT